MINHARARYIACPALMLAAVAMAFSSRAQAEDSPPVLTWSIGAFVGEGVQGNLSDIVPRAVTGKLDFQAAYASGPVLRRAIGKPDWMAQWSRRHDLPTSSSVELALFQMSGLTHNTELVLDWRPAVTPLHAGPTSFEFAWGIGISHSFGKPWSDYTDPDRPEGYNTLFHMAPELALRHAALPGWSLSLHLHHRSGVYGALAPRKVGSNHIGLLLMRSF